MMNNSLGFSERRSVATIVGTFFFLVVMIGGFAALIAAFELNSDLLEGQFKISQQETQKVQEAFTIQAAYDSVLSGNDNTLCVTIDNTGAVPLEVPDLWIANKTDSSRPVTLVNVDYKDSFVPVGSNKNILETRTGPANSIIVTNIDHTLDIKAVTKSGIMKTTELKIFNSAVADPRLDVTAFVFPKNIASGQEVVVGMFVRNAGTTTLLDVKPSFVSPFNGEPIDEPVTSVTPVTGGFPITTPSSVATLRPDETVVFMWAPEITGGVGSLIKFRLQAEAKVLGCDGSTVITSAEDDETIEVVPGVRREIFARPELLITLPNPFGKSSGTAYWAIAAANPTSEAVDIAQVSIQIINADNKDLLQGGQTPISLSPNTLWVVNKNVIFWANSGAQVTVPPFGVKEFIVRAEPSGSAADAPINTIVFSIFSTFGQFNVVPFTFGYAGSPTAVVNVYMNSTTASGGLAQFAKTGIETAKNDVSFNITIVNHGDIGTVINSGARLLINIPPGWTDITHGTVDVAANGLIPRTNLKFADGSTQIPVELETNMGREEGGRTFTFTADAPAVSTVALYILTLTAEGTATGSVIIGPLSESVLQVCPLADPGPGLNCTGA